MLRSRRVLCNNVELARRIAAARWPHVALVVCFAVCVWCVPSLRVMPAVQAAEGGREKVIVPLSGIRIYTDTNSRLLQTVLPPPDAPELSKREKKRLFDALLSDIRSESHLDYLNDGWGHHLPEVTTWILHCAPESARAVLDGLDPKASLGTWTANLLIGECLLACQLSDEQKLDVVETLLRSTQVPRDRLPAYPCLSQALMNRTALVVASIDSWPKSAGDLLLVIARRGVEAGLDCFYVACLLNKVLDEPCECRGAAARVVACLAAGKPCTRSAGCVVRLPEGVKYRYALFPEVAYSLAYTDAEKQHISTLRMENDLPFLRDMVVYEHLEWPATAEEAFARILRRAGPQACGMVMDAVKACAHDVTSQRLSLLAVAAELDPTDARLRREYRELVVEGNGGWRHVLKFPNLQASDEDRKRVARSALVALQSQPDSALDAATTCLTAGEVLYAIGEKEMGRFHLLRFLERAMTYEREFGLSRQFSLPSREFVRLCTERGHDYMEGLIVPLLSSSDWHNRYFAACIARPHIEQSPAIARILRHLARCDSNRFVRAKCEQVLAAPEEAPGVGWLGDLVSREAFGRMPPEPKWTPEKLLRSDSR